MKKIYFFCFAILIFCLSGCVNEKSDNTELSGIDISNVKIGENGENLPVTRGYAAKMSAFLCGSKRDINMCDSYINFTDVSYDSWCGKYVNFCYKNNIIKGTEGVKFEPEKYLTLSEAQYFINAFDKTGTVKIHITEDAKDKPLSLSLWNTIYKKLLSITENDDIKEAEFSVFADSTSYAGMKSNYVITDLGVYCCDGIDISSYKNCRVKGFVKDNDIICITEITDTEASISNAFIKEAGNGDVVIFINGVERKFSCSDSMFTPEMVGNICDFSFKDSKISKCLIHKDKISGVVKMCSDEKAEISSAGTLGYEENMKIYKVYEDEIKQGEISDLCIGRECEFILNNGKIKAVIINGEYIPQDIYVHIKNGSKDYFDEITVKKDNEEIKISKSDLSERRIIERGDNKLIIKIGDSEYEIAGSIEVVNSDDGLIIANKTNIEDYTAAVAAGKADDSMNDEMLKAIAVLTRTEIIKKIYENKLSLLGASADNTETATPNEKILNAVNETKGEVIFYNDEVISAFYFYVSGGATANIGEVWANSASGLYPFEGKEYLASSILNDSFKNIDLSNEDEFKSFINDKGDIYESQNEWYRWEYTNSYSAVSENINSKISDICKKYGNYVKVLEMDGVYRSREISEVGDVKNIEVQKRGEGGNVMEIVVTGSKNVVLFQTMPVISEILSPVNTQVKKNDDTAAALNYVPSMFFCIENNSDSFRIYGGGLGHCVGMSIKGAQKMSESKTYKEIIGCFYKGSYIMPMQQKNAV